MLSDTGARHAHQLRDMLDAGTLPDVRDVEVTHGSIDTLALAVGVVFAELDRLAHDDPTTPDGRARWRAASADVAHLWQVAEAARSADGRAC